MSQSSYFCLFLCTLCFLTDVMSDKVSTIRYKTPSELTELYFKVCRLLKTCRKLAKGALMSGTNCEPFKLILVVHLHA